MASARFSVHFSHFIIYDFDRTVVCPGLLWRVSVAGIALSCVPQSSVFFFNLSSTFSLCPHLRRLGNKAHCFYPLYACASPRAAPTTAPARFCRAGVWGGKGPRDWQADGVPGEHSVTVERPVSFNLFHFFITPTPLF